jgi:hypothetical protein
MAHKHTALEDLDLLDRSAVEERASLEDLQGIIASVGNGSLQTSVANRLEFDVERGVTLDGGSCHQGGECREASKELHLERQSINNNKAEAMIGAEEGWPEGFSFLLLLLN